MRPAAIVVLDPLEENSPQVSFTQRNQMIDAFTPDGANQPLTMSICQRRPRRCLQDLKTKVSQTIVERGGEDRVTIVDEVAVAVLPGKRLAKLLKRPLCRGMLGDVEMEDSSRADFHDDQDTEEIELGGDDSEEVSGDEVNRVLAQERRPALSAIAVSTASWPRHHVFANRPR